MHHRRNDPEGEQHEQQNQIDAERQREPRCAAAQRRMVVWVGKPVGRQVWSVPGRLRRVCCGISLCGLERGVKVEGRSEARPDWKGSDRVRTGFLTLWWQRRRSSLKIQRRCQDLFTARRLAAGEGNWFKEIKTFGQPRRSIRIHAGSETNLLERHRCLSCVPGPWRPVPARSQGDGP